VAAGRVLRGPQGESMAIMSAHFLDGDPIRMQLRRLVQEELVMMPISGPPTLDARGRRLLAVANGMIASLFPD
jgi:hypothetical protein